MGTKWRLRALVLLAMASPVDAVAANAQWAWVDGWTWYAIAGSFKSQREANEMADRLGDPWNVQNTDICVNYTPGYWVVVAGAYSQAEARTFAGRVGGYVKECK